MQEIDFIDRRWVHHTYFLTRQVFQPERFTDDALIAPGCGTGTVLRTPGGMALYYTTVRWVDQEKGGRVHQHWIHYATSTDGVSFDLPKLGLREHAGSRDNNIVLMGHERDADGRWLSGSAGPKGMPVLDATQCNVPNARGRYTAVFLSNPPVGPAGLQVVYSDDGLHWTAYAENPVYKGWPDTYNHCFYDDRIGRFVAYIRPNIHAGPVHVNRMMARIESEDLVTWTNEQVVLDTDDRDAPAVGTVNEAKHPDGSGYPRGRDRQFYGMTVKPYQDGYLGLASYYDTPSGTMWLELVHSYDGFEWMREAKREPFVPLGGEDAWDSALVMYATFGCPFAMGDYWYIYYSGTNFDHHHRVRSLKDRGQFRGLGGVRLKRGRAIGYSAGKQWGDLLTREFALDTDTLALNANASGGRILVEVCDPEGRTLEGFGKADAVPVEGDGLREPVAFRGGAELSRLAGRTVRLRIHVTNATVFGLAFG